MTELGLCQWFHYGDDANLQRAVTCIADLGLRHLRTGVSWADWHRPRGREWYDRQFEALGGLDLLVSVWHTPPSIAIDGRCASPPRRLEDYADFVAEVLDRYPGRIQALELWNEPNNLYKWDFARHDPDWSRFVAMIAPAAAAARARGVPTVLGGMSPVDASWLRLIDRHGGLRDVDVVAFHGFPGMWWPDRPCWEREEDWHGWEAKARALRAAAGSRPLWVTETGSATWNVELEREALLGRQVERLEEAASRGLERVYWYSLIDLDPGRAAIEGFHVDENEYHMGLVRWNGQEKPAYHRMRELLQASLAGGERRSQA